jgi:ABC-type lipoprotein export system ATPase subunit
VILADEPTGEVDSKTRDSIIRIFEELSEKGQTILVVTHDLKLQRSVQGCSGLRTEQLKIIESQGN